MAKAETTSRLENLLVTETEEIVRRVKTEIDSVDVQQPYSRNEPKTELWLLLELTTFQWVELLSNDSDQFFELYWLSDYRSAVQFGVSSFDGASTHGLVRFDSKSEGSTWKIVWKSTSFQSAFLKDKSKSTNYAWFQSNILSPMKSLTSSWQFSLQISWWIILLLSFLRSRKIQEWNRLILQRTRHRKEKLWAPSPASDERNWMIT